MALSALAQLGKLAADIEYRRRSKERRKQKMLEQEERTAASREARQTVANVRQQIPPPRFRSEAEKAKERLREIEEAKKQKMRDAGVTLSEELPELDQLEPLDTGEDFGGGEGFPTGSTAAADLARESAATGAARKFFNAPEPPTAGSAFNDLQVSSPEDDMIEPESLAELQGRQAAQPPRAVPVLPDPGKMRELFRVATGTAFDKNSSRDASYMAKIKAALEDNPELSKLSPRQFALKLYAMG